MKRTLSACIIFPLLATTLSAFPASEDSRMTPELLWKLGRLGASAVSKDGAHVAYVVRRYELSDEKGTSTLFVRDMQSGSTRPLLTDWSSVGALQFAPTPFGERLYFSGRSGRSGRSGMGAAVSQAWALNPLDGALLQVTDLEESIANLKVSPTGTHLAFTADIKLDEEVTDLYLDLPKADARIIDSLMYRHWNAWHDYKYSHLHIAPIGADGRAGAALDLMEDMKVDCPVPPFAGSEQFNWAPDGEAIAFTTKDVERWAESTNSEVHLVNITAPGERFSVSEGRPGYDNDPVFSPDGKWLAYHSMERAGFEADRNRIMIFDRTTKETHEATEGLDQMAHGAAWLPAGDALLTMSEYRGTNQIFQIPRSGGGARQVTRGRFNWSLVDIFPNGTQALVSYMDMIRPRELAVLSLADGTTQPISDINADAFRDLELPTVEERWVTATDGERIHCWVIFPPDFDASKKWPLLTYCQGGPQGQIGQWFSYRWNFHLMAANGYVIVAPNRRGLPGFGRAWNDRISGDWGGQAMQDLLSATDALRAESYIDIERTGAVGASFGGYSVYWLMGNHEQRFQTMIAHCGVYNLESMYGSTEELFFVNWDLGGPYWKDAGVQKKYDRFSPHRFVKNWDTPLLVIHGQKDFRVPVTQGMEAFTAAQVQGVPSRFLYYPEEGHWVQKPQNGVLWHRVFFDWLGRACKPEAEKGP